jgi:hypothetical protein
MSGSDAVSKIIGHGQYHFFALCRAGKATLLFWGPDAAQGAKTKLLHLPDPWQAKTCRRLFLQCYDNPAKEFFLRQYP